MLKPRRPWSKRRRFVHTKTKKVPKPPNPEPEPQPDQGQSDESKISEENQPESPGSEISNEEEQERIKPVLCTTASPNTANNSSPVGTPNNSSFYLSADSISNTTNTSSPVGTPNNSSLYLSSDSVREVCFHDYTHSPAEIEKSAGNDVETEALHSESVSEPPNMFAMEDAKKKLDLFLTKKWMAVVEDDGIYCWLVSRARPPAIQRSVFFHHSGSVEITVHKQKVCSDSYVAGTPDVPIQIHSVNEFVDRAVKIISKLREMEVCAGLDSLEYESVWGQTKGGIADRNPYNEARYVETFRSLSCTLLVSTRTWRCEECKKLLRPLRNKFLNAQKESMPPTTPNVHLSGEQMRSKLKVQHQELAAAKKRVAALHAKIEQTIKKEGVEVDEELDSDLTAIMKESCDISPAQEIFLQQQIKASQKGKKKCGMRWHPTMIRLALAIHLQSPSAYELLRNTGMVRLPSSRTLFDYSHFKPIEEGIDKVVLESIAARLKDVKVKDYQKYHVLIADEMYISKNLVFQKSSGQMVGYTKLDEIDREIRALNEYLDDVDKFQCVSDEIAARVMCYMVKSTAYNIKEVVACYAVNKMSANQMYMWTWQVISALERNGIRVVAFVCDGSSINRAFIKLHTPVTVLPSGTVFDTPNKVAPSRVLYFISDVAHLIKTIRNCFYSSRAKRNKKVAKRCLKRNGKKIVWDYIIRLYKEGKGRRLRTAWKLHPANVFPDSFSCMKVSYAAQVLSESVALALKDKDYEGVGETVHFIQQVNSWFDRLNGCHTAHGKRKLNSNLDPYTSVEDPRFQQLLEFLEYLDGWKAQAYSSGDTTLNSNANASVFDLSDVSDADQSFDPFEDVVDEPEPARAEENETAITAGKRILSHQTLLGIEMTTHSFLGCVKFLLTKGTEFINARVFSQDPLEQFFSKQRAGGGGSSNPNVTRFLNKNRGIHQFGQLGIKCRKGNSTEVGESHVVVTEEPLPKRKCVRKIVDFSLDDSS